MVESIHFDGKCENCGRENPKITISVHTWGRPGAHGNAEWCLDCVQGKNSADSSKFEWDASKMSCQKCGKKFDPNKETQLCNDCERIHD